MNELRIRGVDPEIHKRFKVICVEKGLSMNQILRQFVYDFVKQHDKK